MDELGRAGSEQTAYVNIDRTAPSISGAANNTGYYIGRVITIGDVFGEIESSVYNNGVEFSNGMLFEKPGKYTLTVTDKAGNQSTLIFTVRNLPTVEEIIYTEQSRNLIKDIRTEFNGNTVLSETYRLRMDNATKALENRYAKLNDEVNSIKSDTDKIRTSVNRFTGKTDGLIAIKDQIQELYNMGQSPALTTEQKQALTAEADYLKGLLKTINKLSKQVDDLKTAVSRIPTESEGMIAQKKIVQDCLNLMSQMTKEQQNLLKDQSKKLLDLMDQIDRLQKEADEVIGLITKLPNPDQVKKENADAVTLANERYHNLNREQKELVGKVLENKLIDVTQALKKMMLHDVVTDITVVGVDGTTFSPDVYLKVTPITTKEEKANFAIAAETVENFKNTDSGLKEKVLIALYDVTMFKGDQKIQPNGKVQVKIKVPDELKDREGLDIIHISDDGTVTHMRATREGDYLLFFTTHFSQYGIIAKDNCWLGICKMLGQYDAVNAICYCWVYVVVLVLIIALIVVFIAYKKKKVK